jgi:hypothetical protein
MLTDKNKRAMYKRVDEYAERGNWPAITNIIGGSPRYDLQDLTDADHGEPPQGAQWQLAVNV